MDAAFLSQPGWAGADVLVAAEGRLKSAIRAVNFVVMLEDRDYMRQPVYRDRPQMPQMSFTIALLIVNAVVFLIRMLGLRLSAAVR